MSVDREETDDAIPKTAEDVALLRNKNLSVSSLQKYLDCPVKFYYYSVRGLKEQDEVSESLEANDVGTVYHESMQELYGQPGRRVTRDWLQSLLKGPRIRETVRRKMLKALSTFEVSGRNLLYEDQVCNYVRKTVERDLDLLVAEGCDHFDILGLEQVKTMELEGFRFIGYIDRLDSLRPGEVRVVDYKTGKVTEEEARISDANADTVVEQLFDPACENRPKIALQLYLYDRFVAADMPQGSCFFNAIYQPARLFVEGVENVPVSGRFTSLMDGRFHDLLLEIADTSVPFVRTENKKNCAWCDFKNICGR